MKLQIGICDDVELERETLKEMLMSLFKAKGLDVEIHTFSCGEELLEAERILDLVFLDIEMPGIGGIEAGKQYHRSFSECKIILASGRPDKMREALAVEPLAFVDKPYEDAAIFHAVDDFLSTRAGYNRILLYNNRIECEILQRDIQYAYAYESSTEFVVKNRIMRKEISLNQLEEELDERIFFRIDRQYIVNLNYVEQLENNKFCIGDKRFSISARRQKKFRDKYREYQLHHR